MEARKALLVSLYTAVGTAVLTGRSNGRLSVEKGSERGEVGEVATGRCSLAKWAVSVGCIRGNPSAPNVGKEFGQGANPRLKPRNNAPLPSTSEAR